MTDEQQSQLSVAQSLVREFASRNYIILDGVDFASNGTLLTAWGEGELHGARVRVFCHVEEDGSVKKPDWEWVDE